MEGCAEFSKEFDEFNDSARRGEHGKTAQYWLIYLDLMRNQHALHTAVQENDLKQRLQAWEYFIPYCFATNKSNYARYGSFYLRMMQGIEENYPGLKELLKQNCLSVQAQNSYPLRTATDQRGEQTLNKDAKTTGGVKSFASDPASVARWTLNRAEQANNEHALEEMCGMRPSSRVYKPLRPSQILASEEKVTAIFNTHLDGYINPFDIKLDKNILYNLSSGAPIPNTIADKLVSLPSEGISMANHFMQNRLDSRTVLFHEDIKRNIKKSDLQIKKTSCSKQRRKQLPNLTETF